MNNIVIVIKKSDYEGEGKRRPRVILACEWSGNYKSCKSSKTTDIRSDANSDMKKCARDTGTKKCGCSFLLKCVNIGDVDDWKLEVVCGVHNHPISEYLQGHSFVGRLSQEENALLVDMSKSLVKPRDILVTLKDRDAMNVSTMKTIYNARIRNITKEFAGRTQMQQLLTKLSEHNYIQWHRTSGDIVTDLFWTHPINIEILRAFPHVLIMDCTYKTNRYRFSLLQIVGVTSTKLTFSVAYVYITHQTEVLPDGNCGYRTIAMAMRFGHNEWRRVRKDLLQQLHDMSFVFNKCIREHKRYNEIERALNYFDDGFAPFFYWMTMPHIGHIIATCYNVVLILLSMRQCLTFLPFSVQSSETKLREIAIGFVDDDHYVQA
ncbi:hypothetical protein CerSpe_086350 [Prunus speciosa]